MCSNGFDDITDNQSRNCQDPWHHEMKQKHPWSNSVLTPLPRTKSDDGGDDKKAAAKGCDADAEKRRVAVEERPTRYGRQQQTGQHSERTPTPTASSDILIPVHGNTRSLTIGLTGCEPVTLVLEFARHRAVQ